MRQTERWDGSILSAVIQDNYLIGLIGIPGLISQRVPLDKCLFLCASILIGHELTILSMMRKLTAIVKVKEGYL